MLVDNSLVLRQSLIAYLTNRTDAVDRVYDDVDPSSLWPFIRVSITSTTGWEATGQSGSMSVSSVHVFSKGPGTKEAMTIAGQVVRLLEEFDMPGDLQIAEWTWDATNILPDPAVLGAYHAIVQYRGSVISKD